MTSFSLRQVKLRPGEQYRDELELELAPLSYGGQRYLPVPEKVPAEFEITRANTGTVFSLAFTARLFGPCYRCLGDAVLELPIRAREYQAENPEDEELTTEYIEGNMLDVSGVGARRDCARAAGEDPLPSRLRRPLRRVRQEPERRAAHARGRARRPALGRSRSATRPNLSGAPSGRRRSIRRASVRASRARPRAGSRTSRATRSTACSRPGSMPGASRSAPRRPPRRPARAARARSRARARGVRCRSNLGHAAVARAVGVRREGGPARHLAVLARDDARPDEVAAVPFLPRRDELLERAGVDALLVDVAHGIPVGGQERIDDHSLIVRVTASRSRKRRSCVTTTRQPA